MGDKFGRPILSFHFPKGYPIEATMREMAIALGKFAQKQMGYSGRTLAEVILVERDVGRARAMLEEYKRQFEDINTSN